MGLQTNPKGLTGTWSQAEGGKGEKNAVNGVSCRLLAHCTESSGRGWRVVGGGWGRRTGGRIFAPVEEVGRVFKREELRKRMLQMGGYRGRK